MTDTDYNRRMATALGWTDFSGSQPRDFRLNNGLFGVPPGASERTQEQKDLVLGRSPVPDYAIDWTQLPAILAALLERGPVTIEADKDVIIWAGDDDSARGANLLLAAGALLLKLAEGKS